MRTFSCENAQSNFGFERMLIPHFSITVERTLIPHFSITVEHTLIPVYERIFILVWIEYRILFALAKLSESNSEYYSCCIIYSNNIRIVQNIWIFEYFRIICNAKIKIFRNNIQNSAYQRCPVFKGFTNQHEIIIVINNVVKIYLQVKNILMKETKILKNW